MNKEPNCQYSGFISRNSMEVKQVNSSTIRMNSEKENLENPEHFIEKYDPNSLKIKISKTRPLENVSKWHKTMVRKDSSECTNTRGNSFKRWQDCQSHKTTSHSDFSIEKENTTTSDKKRSLKVEDGVEGSKSKRIKISVEEKSSNDLKKSKKKDESTELQRKLVECPKFFEALSGIKRSPSSIDEENHSGNFISDTGDVIDEFDVMSPAQHPSLSTISVNVLRSHHLNTSAEYISQPSIETESMIIPYSLDPNQELTSRVPLNRKIYSGKRPTLLVMPSLRQFCYNIIHRKLDSLKNTRNMDFTILKPVLVKATPKQVLNIEKNNPYLLPFTDVLWESHCKTFVNERKDKKETWREMYVRCTNEREEKIRNLSEKYRNCNKGACTGRLTKIIDTLPPKRRGERSVESTVHERSMKTSTQPEFQMFTKNVPHNSSSNITTSTEPGITEKEKIFSSNNEMDVSKLKKLPSKTLQNDTKTSAASATEKSVSKNLTKPKRKGNAPLMKKAHQIMKFSYHR
ncbi:UNVERIFIED_CONTAM: hypothetical protein RMT77_002884 [Armadillidium vulgare]